MTSDGARGAEMCVTIEHKKKRQREKGEGGGEREAPFFIHFSFNMWREGGGGHLLFGTKNITHILIYW